MVQKVSRICLIYRCYILPQIHFGDYMNFKRFIFSVLAAIVLVSNNVYAIEKPVINPNTVDGVLAHVNGKPIMLTDIYPFISAHRKNIIENKTSNKPSPCSNNGCNSRRFCHTSNKYIPKTRIQRWIKTIRKV